MAFEIPAMVAIAFMAFQYVGFVWSVFQGIFAHPHPLTDIGLMAWCVIVVAFFVTASLSVAGISKNSKPLIIPALIVLPLTNFCTFLNIPLTYDFLKQFLGEEGHYPWILRPFVLPTMVIVAATPVVAWSMLIVVACTLKQRPQMKSCPQEDESVAA